MNYLLLSSLSFLIGTLVGLTGVGGASLITPMLVFVFQVPPSVAISSDIVAATFMKIFGSIKHWQQKTIDGQVVKWLACGSVPGSFISQAAILLTSTSLGHLGLGTVNWSLVIPICLGSIPGIVLGAKLCQIVPQGLLRFGTYIILELVSWKLVFPVSINF